MKNLMLKTATLVFLLTLTMSITAAFAVDDGGGRSVFARGAGERALALGGAYAAIANDPSAMIWNPAGLARVDRKSLYASHSSLIGLGFSEQLGLVTIPNWAIGTFGLGIRRFGVDGIQGFDDRGTLLDENLKDAETEILLGFGRKLGSAWSMGLTFKYQQHELAGYSDGAPGLDLGVMVKPLIAAGKQSNLANSLTAGFAIRNLIEPNLRLDEEGVKDPTGLRFGLAFDKKLTRNIHLLVAADLEKTREMDTKIHAGAEVRLMDILALRVGSNSDMLTAGAGFTIGGIVADYTFEDNPLETVHRFGLGLAFGPTTTETRQARLEARETALRKQAAEAFLRDNTDRIHAVVAQAETALRNKNHAEALLLTETVKVLDPGFDGLKRLEADAFYGQGLSLEQENDLSRAAIAYQRCLAVDPKHSKAIKHLKSVSEKNNRLAARSEVIRAQFDKALEAYARGDLLLAQKGFAGILELNPADREAAALLKNTEQTLELRSGALVEKARALTMANSFAAARQALSEATKLYPGNSAIKTVTALIAEQEQLAQRAQQPLQSASQSTNPTNEARSARVSLAPAAAPKPTFAALSAKDQQEISDLYSKGLKAVEDNRHEDAIRYWELVWSRAPDYQKVAENLKQEYLALGMESFAAGSLDQSIRIWEKAQSVDPDDARTRGYLARAYEHKSRIREIKGDH